MSISRSFHQHHNVGATYIFSYYIFSMNLLPTCIIFASCPLTLIGYVKISPNVKIIRKIISYIQLLYYVKYECRLGNCIHWHTYSTSSYEHQTHTLQLHLVIYCLFLYSLLCNSLFAAVQVSFAQQTYTITEGGVVDIMLVTSTSNYEFDFTVTLQHMDGSATGESFHYTVHI